MDQPTFGRIDLDRQAPAALAFLASGEQLALEAAVAAAQLAQAPDLQRMFARQATQEARHLRVFALVGLACKRDERRGAMADGSDAWASCGLAQCIRAAQDARDLVGLVVATQGVLEAVGASALALIEQHLVGSPARWLLRAILREERAHQRIGERALARLVAERSRSADHVDEALEACVPAGAAMLEAIGGALALAEPVQSRLRSGFDDAIAGFRRGIVMERTRGVTVRPDGAHSMSGRTAAS